MSTIGRRISSAKAKQLLTKGAVLLDTRSPVDFRDGTIPGAINLAIQQLPQLRKHSSQTPIVAFGQTDNDPRISTMLGYLQQYGFINLFTIGAIDNWYDNKVKSLRKSRG